MRQSRRIDQPNTNYPSYQLYQPLRRSLLRQNLSQSHISSHSNLSLSRYNPTNNNNLQNSRISKRIRSLSPDEIQTIKSNILIPVNKRLVPTKNLEIIRNKKYNAIDVEERVHKAIPAIKFNSCNRFNVNLVQKVVYQVEEDGARGMGQERRVSGRLGERQYRAGNIYTVRSGYDMARNTNRFRNAQFQTVVNSTNHAINPTINTHFARVTPHQTSMQSSISFRPAVSQTFFQPHRPSNIPSLPYSCNPIRQLPTSDYLPLSRTSFQQQPLSSQVNKGYDFSRLTLNNNTPLQTSTIKHQQSSTSSSQNDYTHKKKEQWKYNLYSMFDQPANTRCAKTGCFRNQIVATRPNLYQWQQ